MGTSTNKLEIKRFEISEVYAHPEATVDIVLVHGLNGHPQKTWTAKNGVFWPADLLPQTLKTVKARILVYGYNADVWAFGNDKSPSSDMIHQHAQTLVSTLAMERTIEGYDEHPIIWIAHSLGGILVKRALQLSHNLSSRSSDLNRSIFVCTYGIIFLGTPHTGADPAKWGQILQSLADVMIPKKMMDTEPILVQTLKSNNETLQNINLEFLNIYGKFEVEMVHEAMKTDLKASRAFIVDKDSASPLLPGVNYFGIEATHSGMCKFESKNSPGYTNIAQKILIWARDCPPVIQSRIISEQRDRKQAKQDDAKEMLGIYNTIENQNPGTLSQQSSTINTPALSNSGIISTSMIHSVASIEPDPMNTGEIPFVKPHDMRPNSHFVGRKSELKEMYDILFDKQRRAEGTSAVLLQCIPGGGKTHLARKFVYDHFNEFPGGVFWVRAKSPEQLADGFWEIARKVAFKPLSEDDKEMGLIRQNPEEFVKIVIDWLETNHEWLLILDGIHFDHSELLTKYIPDSKNSSLIYTSTERNVEGDHHFVNPRVIRLPPLSEQEAQELFLLELGKSNPTQVELQYSMELVRRMDFLPLVIYTAARQLRATEEPIKAYARHYASGPKLRGLEPFHAVVEQLKAARANEALNLMNTICFFSQHVPVEMIVLGLKELDVPVKAYESASGASINNTFKILNRFALIDRSEEPLQSSQSSKGSREWLADDIDVIRLHSVVQDYFTDVLRADGQLPLWLGRAVTLFCRSYDHANFCIKQKTDIALVGDYRSYEIHGKKLQEHATRHEKKFPALKDSKQRIDAYLLDIKNEIDQHTRQSSQDLVHGRAGKFQVSIFDRTSSSSDTNPETPSKKSSRSSTWGVDRVRIESPSDMSHDENLHPSSADDQMFPFPNLPALEDRGYESDGDTASMTVRPPFPQSSPRQDDDGWHIVRGRNELSKPHRRTSPFVTEADKHRTIRTQEKQRYHDSAGSWRAVKPTASDPRVSTATASVKDFRLTPVPGATPSNFNPISHMRPTSRGRSATLSGSSQAVVELGRINKISPPPTRGGGMIQDRRRSSQRRPASMTDSEGRLLAGLNPYASSSVHADMGFLPGSELRERNQSSGRPSPLTSPPARPVTLAQASLERIPHASSEGVPLSPLPLHIREEVSPRLGVARLAYKQPYPSSDTALYSLPGRYSDDELSAQPSSYQPNPSFHSMRGTRHEDPRAFQPGYSSINTNYQSSSLGSAVPKRGSLPENLSPYSYSAAATGYTSQPMSRGPSAESGGGYSVAESEPLPQLPNFSPHIEPTSYAVYQELHSPQDNANSTKEKWAKVINLSHARNSSGSSINERRPNDTKTERSQMINEYSSDRRENERQNSNLARARTQSPFNPTAPMFIPHAQTTSPYLPQQASLPRFPPPAVNRLGTQFMHQNTPPTTFSSPVATNFRPETSGSGGFKVPGGQVIGFGDFPEVVDVMEKRKWRENEDRRRKEEAYQRWREGVEDARVGSQERKMEAISAGERTRTGLGIKFIAAGSSHGDAR